MWKVCVIDEEHEDDLTESVNLFLAEHATCEIKDIKFSSALAYMNDTEQCYCFSAMIIYQDKTS